MDGSPSKNKKNLHPLAIVDAIQNILDYRYCKSYHFKNPKSLGRVAFTALCLGCTLMFHILLIVYVIIYTMSYDDIDVTANRNNFHEHKIMLSIVLQWSTYFLLLCSFHILEFFTTALNEDDELSNNSFVVNHSKEYTIAATFSWLEFWFTSYLQYNNLLPYNKLHYFWYYCGIFLVILGQFIRSYAMLSCGKNFSHLIMTQKRDDHRLVTNGIYSILRHPSYFGFFYWSIGTQILLANPISFLLYAVSSWYFFYGRIPIEESTLYEFYGNEYKKYCRKTYVGIPFLKSSQMA